MNSSPNQPPAAANNVETSNAFDSFLDQDQTDQNLAPSDLDATQDEVVKTSQSAELAKTQAETAEKIKRIKNRGSWANRLVYLEKARDAQKRKSDAFDRFYQELKQGDSTKAERVATIKDALASIDKELEIIMQELEILNQASQDLSSADSSSPDETTTATSETDQPNDAVDAEPTADPDSNPETKTPIGDLSYTKSLSPDGRHTEIKLDDGQGTTTVIPIDLIDSSFGASSRPGAGPTDSVETPTAPFSVDPTEPFSAPVYDPTYEASPISPTVRQVNEKLNQKPSFMQRAKGKIIAGISATLAALAIATSLSPAFVSSSTDENAPDINPAPIEQQGTMESQSDDFLDPTGELEQQASGIYDGYGETGMYLSQNKPSPNSFASASEVAQLFNNDECEMIKYTAHNQVESFADYLANLPEQLQPDGFKGLSIKATEEKLESLSPEAYDQVKLQFDAIIDAAFTRTVIADGPQENALMRDTNLSNGEVTHQDMEVVACTTNEDNLEVRQLFWQDQNGSEIGHMTVKIIPIYDNGKIVGFEGCMQVINEAGEKVAIYLGLPIISEDTPDTPPDTPQTPAETPPDNPETPSETPTPDTPTPPAPNTPDVPTPPTPNNPSDDHEWGKSGDPHGGDLVDPSDSIDPNSEVSKEENDATNQGNQVYVDDNQATPGTSSEANGVGDNGYADSGITAPGATTDGDRLEGGANQSGPAMNGENAYQNQETIEQGQQADQVGNNAQQQAQQSGAPDGGNLAPEGDNLTDADEESVVAGGNF